MDKDRWTAITIDDVRTLVEVGEFDANVVPSNDDFDPQSPLDNPLSSWPCRNSLLKDLAVCAITKPPEEFVAMVDANMEQLLHRSFLNGEVAKVLVEGLRLGISKKCGASACLLGAFYYDGSFVEQNYESAAELYELGMEWGSVQAMINLGYIYEYGRIGERDYAQAYQYYSLAAALAGESEALNKMGDLLSKGKGVKKGHCMAVRLWKRSWDAAPDSALRAQAAIRLAPLYLEGDQEAKIEQDILTALKFYQEAEIGLRLDIAKGLTYYEKRLAEAIEGQAAARKLLDEPAMIC